MEYPLDSNSLIDAYNRWYRPHVFGNVWNFLSTNPKVKMTSFVFEEIKYPSGLTNWTKANFVTSQIHPDQSTILTYTQIMDWITNCTRWDSAGIDQWQRPGHNA